MSYAVSQSTREFGLRIALGATGADLLRLILSRGMLLTACGILLGAIMALMLTRLMTNLLYRVSPTDATAFGLALAIMTIVALVACLLPGWRATLIDPARALRA
jgi:ABC-type antimicrobial peptide transport system permease subunit